MSLLASIWIKRLKEVRDLANAEYLNAWPLCSTKNSKINPEKARTLSRSRTRGCIWVHFRFYCFISPCIFLCDKSRSLPLKCETLPNFVMSSDAITLIHCNNIYVFRRDPVSRPNSNMALETAKSVDLFQKLHESLSGHNENLFKECLANPIFVKFPNLCLVGLRNPHQPTSCHVRYWLAHQIQKHEFIWHMSHILSRNTFISWSI